MWSRLRAIIEHAVNGLSERDRRERILWCQQHDQHGVRTYFNDDETVTLVWGGARLAVVDKAVLFDDGVTFTPTFVREFDHVPDEWSGDD